MAQPKKPSGKKSAAKGAGQPDNVERTKPDSTQDIEDAVVLQDVAVTPLVDTERPNSDGKSSGVLPLIAGGVIAGATGFGAAVLLGLTTAPDQTDTSATKLLEERLTGDLSKLTQDMTAANSNLADLNQTVEGQKNSDVAAGIEKRLDEFDRLSVLQAAALVQITDRVNDLEQRTLMPANGDTNATAEISAELAALRAQIADEMAALSATQMSLAAAQKAAEKTGPDPATIAIAKIEAAINNGENFAEPASDLSRAGVEVPAGLLGKSQDGVVTLAQLQSQFPDAARASLNGALRAQADAGGSNRLGAFLRIQLGARSLEPRQGTDPDAILSRAEAALAIGDLESSISEIRSLPEAGRAPMAAWLAQAETRQDAINELAILAAAIKS